MTSASRLYSWLPVFCLYRILTLGFSFLTGLGHIDRAGSSVFAEFIGEYLDRPARSIGEHSGSQNSYPWARKIRAVVDTHQVIIGHDASVMSWILPGSQWVWCINVTGKRKSPVRSQILPSPILLKKVTATEKPCSLDDFLAVKLTIK